MPAGCAYGNDQCILAGTARANDKNEPSGSDPLRQRGINAAHATRFPARQTLRTAEPFEATWTRMRSARLPTVISPRSVSPTASAGDLVTVRTAAARSMFAAMAGNLRAASKRLERT